MFGSSFADNCENIDQKHWNQNLIKLLNGKDSSFGIPTGAKRQRKSLNQSLNESFLENFNGAALNEPDSLDNIDPLIRLQAINEIQGKKLASITDLFKKSRVATPASRHGGGSVLKFGKKVKAYAISLMCQGESSMSIWRSLRTLAMICPEVLENADGSVGSIPSRQTLDYWRSQIPALNTIHCKQFIESDDEFVLAVDATDISNTQLLNLGVFNSSREYICLATQVLIGKDHIAISDMMKTMLEPYPEVVDKLNGIISDQGSAQIKANVRFAQLIGRTMGQDFIQYLCTLHSTKNQDEKWCKEFPMAERAVHNSMMLFGNRQNSSNSQCSLRNELEVGLVIESNKRKSPFRSNKGQRMAIGYENGRALLQYRDLVIRVVSMEKARTNKYAIELRKLLTTDWIECQAQLGAYCTHWLCVLNPYYSSMGKKVNLGRAKAICRELLDRNEQLVESSESYNVLLGFITPELIASHPFLSVVTQFWTTADQAAKQAINALVKDAAISVQKKTKKDTKIILDMVGNTDKLVPMSNNYCEGSFAHIKEIHLRFSSMDKEMKGQLGQARQNHVGAWVLAQSDADLDQLLVNVENQWRVNRPVQQRLKTLRDRSFYDSFLNDVE